MIKDRREYGPRGFVRCSGYSFSDQIEQGQSGDDQPKVAEIGSAIDSTVCSGLSPEEVERIVESELAQSFGRTSKDLR